MSLDTIVTTSWVLLLLTSVGLGVALTAREVRHLRRHREGVPPPFETVVTHDEHRKAVDYTAAKLRYSAVLAVLDGLLLAALTLGGGLALLLQGWAWAFDQGHVGALTAGVGLILSVQAVELLIAAPAAAWHQFSLEARFGFNRSTWRTFLTDQAKGLVLMALLGGGLAAVALLVAGHRLALGPWWWAVLWAGWAAFVLAMQVAFPTLVAPWFNTFTPLPEGSLRTRLEALLARCRFPAAGLFVMDGSRRSGHGNAFFAGLGRARRIVLFDTLLTQLSEGQLEAVLAHEIGHARCGHVPRLIGAHLAAAGVTFAAFGLWLDHRALIGGLGVPPSALASAPGPLLDAVALSLFGLLVPPVAALLQPLAHGLSRRYEFEADAYAARVVSPEELVGGLLALCRDNAVPLTTDPVYSLFTDTHPPVPLRVAALREAAGPPTGSG